MPAAIETHDDNPPRDLRARLTLWFFRRFFRLLLIGISIAEATLLWWATSGLKVIPNAVYLLSPFVLYFMNSALSAAEQRRRRLQGPVGALPGFYYAFAFASVFCFAFLIVNSALWIGVKVFLGAIAAQAMTIGTTTSLGSGIDTIFRWSANTGIAAIALSFVYGYSFGQLRLKVRRIPLTLRSAPAAWRGLKIAQISDIHVGQNLEPEQLRRFVARVNELGPDIICITGDIADSIHSDLDLYFPILSELRATHGVFAILGNHDHYAGPERVVAALQQHTNFTVLRDDVASIDIRGHRLNVIGLDDRGRDWARGVLESSHLDEALATVDADDAFLLLCHRPDLFPYAASLGIDLTLSGHTHGGQIGMPWINGRTRNLAEFITKFDRGLYERDGNYLYVNCGLGVTAQRIRLCTPREITLIELRAPAAEWAA